MNQQESVVAWAQYMRSKPNAVVIDTESCGGSFSDEVISLGICGLADGKVLFNSLFNPQGDVKFNWYASQVHGITQNQLKSAPSIQEQWHKIYPLLHNNDVLAYNISADRRMLSQTIKKYNLQVPYINWHCIMNAYKGFMVRSTVTNLTTACGEMNVKAGEHDALGDALAATRLVYRIAHNYGKTETIKLKNDDFILT